jgi:hypothetical protein
VGLVPSPRVEITRKKKMDEEDSRRSDDVEINLWGVHLKGSVRALVSLLTGTFSVLGLIALVAYHVIVDIKYNEQNVVLLRQIEASINLQTAILVIPQEHRQVFANKLSPEAQKSLGLIEGR